MLKEKKGAEVSLGIHLSEENRRDNFKDRKIKVGGVVDKLQTVCECIDEVDKNKQKKTEEGLNRVQRQRGSGAETEDGDRKRE